MFDEILSESRLLQVLYEMLPEEVRNNPLYEKVKRYLNTYASKNKLKGEELINIYSRFLTDYNKDCKNFIKTGKYPLFTGVPEHPLSRLDYDVVLLMSVLFTGHRFRIMQLIEEHQYTGTTLFIGMGPGLEMELIRHNATEIHAYDLSVSEFLYENFSQVSIHKELYTGQKHSFFDVIYLIELLEHLEDPYDLLQISYDSLKDGGKVLLTTATDIPQFDHLVNFQDDHSEFESQLNKMGFRICYKERIQHQYLTLDIAPSNHFYILEK